MTLPLDCTAGVSGLLDPHQHPSILRFMKSVEPRGFLEGVCSIRDKSSGLSGLTQHQLHKFMSESIHSVLDGCDLFCRIQICCDFSGESHLLS